MGQALNQIIISVRDAEDLALMLLRNNCSPRVHTECLFGEVLVTYRTSQYRGPNTKGSHHPEPKYKGVFNLEIHDQNA